MNATSRMVALLSAMRRERNGAVADAMHYYGARYGLNYGVSLPTLRQLAREERPDSDLARLLWQQDVRELRLAALHLLPADQFTASDLAAWCDGITNSEVAEEAAFALLARSQHLATLLPAWLAEERPLLQYAALLAGARVERIDPAWLTLTLAAVKRLAEAEATGQAKEPYAARLVAQGAVRLLTALAAQGTEERTAVQQAVASLGASPHETFVREEIAWLTAE